MTANEFSSQIQGDHKRNQMFVVTAFAQIRRAISFAFSSVEVVGILYP